VPRTPPLQAALYQPLNSVSLALYLRRLKRNERCKGKTMSPTPTALRLMAVAIFALASTAAIAAPKELYGKSIVISWGEDRMQRHADSEQFKSAARNGTLSVYVSSAGNVFNRLGMANHQTRRGRGKEGSEDQVGSAGRSNVSFQGHSMQAVQSGGGGARLIVVTFDQGFTSCTANVINGKAEGAGSMTKRSLINPGSTVEIQSVHTSGVTCSMQDGNVFE
jgi:hypothetical protein